MKKSPLFLVLGVIALIFAGALTHYGISSATAPANIPTSTTVHASHGMILLGLLPVTFVLLLFVTWIYALVDMLKNTAIQGAEKIVWALVIIFLHIVGAIIYFYVAPKPRPGLNLSDRVDAQH